MAEPDTVYPGAHYYLLAKGKYLHGDSWLEDFRKVTAFYLDKATVSDSEVFHALLGEVYNCIIASDNVATEFTYLFECVDRYLDNIKFNADIARGGWKEAWAQGCATMLMRLQMPPGVSLGEVDARILPIVQDQTPNRRGTA